MIGIVIAIVKKRDVPLRRKTLEERQQRFKPFRKLEPIDEFVREQPSAASDHVANMVLGHFVLAEVQNGKPFAPKELNDLALLGLTACQGDSDKQLRRHRGVREAIVELRNGSRTKGVNESTTASGLFRNGDGEERFTMLRDFRAVGDCTQAVEV